MNRALFLDKDGTIIEDNGYLTNPNDIKLIPGSAQAIERLNKAGWKVIVVSNQAGIAKGHLTEDVLQSIDKRLQKKLLNLGAFLDAIYYCPHHPEYGVYPYRRACDCRKPNPGLIKYAERVFNIDLASSYMIGDKTCDIKAGESAGVRSILVLTGRGTKSREDESFKNLNPVYIADDLLDAVGHVLDGTSRKAEPAKVKVLCK